VAVHSHAADEPTSPEELLQGGPQGPWRPSFAAIAALVSGLIVTAALALTALAVYNNNERRLLNLRSREVSLVLAATVPSVQTPLASAAELAAAEGGSAQKFRAFIGPYVGLGREYASVSLWPVGGARLAPTAVVGSPPVLASDPARARQFLTQGTHPGVLNVTGLLNPARPTLGFAFAVPAGSRTYVVYAENPLPANRRSRLEANTAFSDLNYAVYLGRSTRTSDVLLTSVRTLPIKGRQARAAVPFGSTPFTIVISPNGSLGGAFFKDLWWIIVVLGVIVTLVAALLTDRLAKRRRRAEQLALMLDRVAAENRHMYTEQRSISQTLQHALLPDTLPSIAGLRVDARYIPAASGVDVGGDWYDIVDAGEGRVLLVIGDVSGHGLRAATNMALVRHAALAYASVDPDPRSVLERLSAFVNKSEHDYFATVLCALIDTSAHTVTLSSAGHMPPLLLQGEQGAYVNMHTDLPIGVAGGSQYREETVPVPTDATLVAFTDGLVERRNEILDVGLARLLDLATRQRLPLAELLQRLADELGAKEHHDDTAIVGIQWQS
jgi:serine phosphatase RsbU (regulator of sigma subunit)